MKFFGRTRTASREIACDPALAWDILSDYAGWPRWLPLISAASELAREANFARIDLELGGRKLSAECIHTPDSKVLIKSRNGHQPPFALDWTITPGGEGRTAIQMKCTGLSAIQPEQVLDALAARAGTFASDPKTGPTDPATILEIYETEQGLMCWYRGRKYEMKAVS